MGAMPPIQGVLPCGANEVSAAKWNNKDCWPPKNVPTFCRLKEHMQPLAAVSTAFNS
jgi:hypothetical protein